MFTLNQQISLLRNDLSELKINSGDFSGGIIEYTISTISNIDDKTHSLSGSLDTLSGNVSSISGSVDTLSGNVTSISGSLDTLSGNVTSISGSLDTLSTNVTSISGSLDTLTDNVTSISGSLDTLTDNVTSISGSLDTLYGNVGELQTNKQDTITNQSDLSLNNLRVLGDFIVDGSFNINNIIQNDITINNEILISTQLDISNEGTGPALRVTQLGTGDNEHVALFNAGSEGDSLLIDSSGNTTIYKKLEVFGDVSMNNVRIETLHLDNIDINHFVTSISGSLDTLSGNVTTISGSLDTLSTNVTTISGSLDTLSTNVTTISGSLDTLSTNVTTISGSLDTLSGNVTSISGSLDTLSSNVTSISGSVDTLSTNVTSISGSLDTLSGNVTSISGSLDTLSTNVTTISGSLDTLSTNVGELQRDKQDTITNESDLSLNNLRVTGDFTVDGSFNINNVIQNDITINNEILISTQLDISNEGTGPALKVTQLGSGPEKHVALFNAGEEGDSLLIDSSGNTTIYKSLEVIGDVSMNHVRIETLDVSNLNGTLSIDKIIGLSDELAGLQSVISTNDLSISDVSGLQTALNNKYDDTGGTINGSVNISGDLVVGTTNIINEIGTKQDEINTGDLSITDTDGLESALIGKYDKTGGTITGSATITGDLVVGTTNIITEIGTKQNEINTGDLSITDTDGLESALNAKQDDITEETDLSFNSITTKDLVVNRNVYIDTTQYFDTLVVRRPTGGKPTGDDRIVLNELQVWVDGVNILFQNSNILNGYFANWSNKDVPLEPLFFEDISRSVDLVYNNILEGNGTFGTHSDSGNAMIIKNIPLTTINSIQSIMYYNRHSEDRSIGLVVELYNSTNDPDLNTPLSTTNEIVTYSSRYRFDFPSISSYTSFVSGGSTEFIVDETDALTEDAIITPFTFEISGDVSMNNDLSIGGDLVVGTTNILTEIATKQDEIKTDDLSITDVSGLRVELNGLQSLITESTDLSFGTIEANHGIFDTIDISNIRESGLQSLITNESDISLSNLHVLGDFTVDGSFNINNVIQNDITINNEILISTQLDISNEGTGPALKVTQLGSGPEKHVAIFNAGEEGDSLLIDSSGNTTIYKSLEVIGDVSMNKVDVSSLNVSGTAIVEDLSINGTLYYAGLNLESNSINPDSDISVNSLYVRTNTKIQDRMAISMDICDNYVLSVSGDVFLKGRLIDEFGDEYIGTSGSSGIFTSNDTLNYTTNKNVNIGTSDICSNYTLNVDGGVRLYDSGLPSSYELFNYNDWIPDLCNNIYYTNGNVGIGVYNKESPYILDIRGGVRIKNEYDSLNIIDVSGGWASAQDYIYYPNKVVIGGTTDVGDDSKLYVNGTITADILNLTSDKRLKDQIEDISDSLTILRQLYPKKYSKGSNIEIGFIANDVLEINDISFVVSTTNTYYSLNYNSLFSLSIQAIKDLDTEVNELKTKNAELEQRLEALEHFIHKNM